MLRYVHNLIFLSLGFFFFPAFLFAHEGSVGGLIAGLSHPVLGLDHLLAMVSVGIVSFQLSGKAIWSVPVTFVVVMAIGGILGMLDIGLIAIELGIALSVLVLGITIALNSSFNKLLIYLFVALFATFHGYAHGLEIPELAASWSYVIGFMSGTTLLHLLGVGIGYFSRKVKNGTVVLRYTGAIVSGIGFHIIFIIFEVQDNFLLLQ